MPEFTPTFYLPAQAWSYELNTHISLNSRLLQHHVRIVIGKQWLLNQNVAKGYLASGMLRERLNRTQVGHRARSSTKRKRVLSLQ